MLERFILELDVTDTVHVHEDQMNGLTCQLRGFMLKMQACHALCSIADGEELCFRIELHSRPVGAVAAPLPDEMREGWVECDLGGEEEEKSESVGQVLTLKSMSNPKLPLRMQLHVRVREED